MGEQISAEGSFKAKRGVNVAVRALSLGLCPQPSTQVCMVPNSCVHAFLDGHLSDFKAHTHDM